MFFYHIGTYSTSKGVVRVVVRLWAYTLERVISKMAPQRPRAPQGPHSEQSLRGVLVGLLGFDRIPLTPEMYSDKRDSDSPSLVFPT